MTRPVCDARVKAWQEERLRREMAGTRWLKDEGPREACSRPDGCGAAAGEECREHGVAHRWEQVGALTDACAVCGLATDASGGGIVYPTTLCPGAPPACCGKCGGYLTGEIDRCVCDDAKPRVDVSALLAERDRVRGILGAMDGETAEDAAERVSADAANARAWFEASQSRGSELDVARAEARELQGEVDRLLVERDEARALAKAPLPDDLAAIEALLAAATVAPWHAGVDADGEFPDSVYATQDPAREALVSCDEEADAVFVAAIRNAAPRLLAGTRAQVAEVARLDRLAKAERALRLALAAWVCSRGTAEESEKHSALVVAERRLLAAGGVP